MQELPSPTMRELEILKVLWEHGPTSVRGVQELIPSDPDEELAYTTIQTMLRIMETKKLVSHHVEGRTFIYSPLFSRDESATRYLERVFDGAASQLMLSLLRTERISQSELDQIYQLIQEARSSRNGSKVL